MIRKSTSLQPFEAGSADPDPAETAQDLWFLPGPDAAEDITPPHSPGALRAPLFKPAEWRAAEAMLTADLAALCHDAGRLQERLAVMGEGARM